MYLTILQGIEEKKVLKLLLKIYNFLSEIAGLTPDWVRERMHVKTSWKYTEEFPMM